MLRLSAVSLLVLSLLSACQKSGTSSPAASAAAASAHTVLSVQAEDVYQVKSAALAFGPVITGVIAPERRADLRAEVPAVVVQVLKENGDSVKRGELLLRLDDTAIRDSLNSAEEAVRAASQSLQQSERVVERQKTLRASGMTSSQALEDAELRRNAAQNDLVAAKARAVQARQQLQRTEVRAPFDGLVSERKASVGDTAQIGKELLKVIDPTSMRFDGLIAADKIGDVKVGQSVNFKVNGYAQEEFLGNVKRVDPLANSTTRQVAVQVAFADARQPRVAGLYAEGRIETGASTSLIVPEAVLLRAGDKSYVWRVDGGKLAKVALVLGERDTRTGNFVVKSGLLQGDKLIRNPGSSLKEGQTVALANPLPANPQVSAGGANQMGK